MPLDNKPLILLLGWKGGIQIYRTDGARSEYHIISFFAGHFTAESSLCSEVSLSFLCIVLVFTLRMMCLIDNLSWAKNLDNLVNLILTSIDWQRKHLTVEKIPKSFMFVQVHLFHLRNRWQASLEIKNNTDKHLQ